MTDWPITTEDGVPIFPPTDPRDAHLHVLLDGAADGNTVAGLYALFPEAEGCLLLAVRHEARHLAQSGPFLARIPLDARAREWAQRDAGRNGSSIFLFSSLGFYPLCRHLESLLTCETTYGQRLFFRFFDQTFLLCIVSICNILLLRVSRHHKRNCLIVPVTVGLHEPFA